MKKNLLQFPLLLRKEKIRTYLLSLLVFGFSLPAVMFSQQTYTFTNCNATGNFGPSQTQINNAYQSTNLQGNVTQLGNGVQSWTVPTTGAYGIRAIGASGGISTTGCTTAGGMGADMYGEFNLTAGQVLLILVGQEGVTSTNSEDGGGGGGTYVTTSASVAMVVAGGGGGSTSNLGSCSGSQRVGVNASLTQTATNGANGLGAGGVNGNGGQGSGGGAGGGFFTNGTGGTTSSIGYSFMNGGAGGNYITAGHGGFGGGGSGFWEGGNGGGGGGYSGGGTNSNSNPYSGGGGGGSYNNGINQTNIQAISAGHGRVIISELCNIKIFASGSNSLNPVICSGQSLTLTTTAVSNYTWSNNNTSTTSIVVSPTSNQTYSIVGTSTANCQSVAFITVSVSAAPPVLSISNPSNNICLGRSVSLTATGAITYTWLNTGVVNGQTFTPSSTAVYTVSGQNGCGIVNATTTITVSQLPVTIAASPTSVCEGYTSTLTAQASVSGFTWMPGPHQGSIAVVGPMVNTVFTVTASDGTCSGTQTVLLTTKPTPTITALISSNKICQGDQVTLTASGAGAGGTYSWTPGGAGATINLSPPSTTVFAVSGTNSVGCSASAQQYVLVDSAPPLSASAVGNKTIICSGQSAVLSAAGAANYSWLSGGPSNTSYTVSPTTQTTYTVVGTHLTNTCSATRTIEISVVTPSVTLTNSAATCAGQAVVVTATGATTYTWNGVPVLDGAYTSTPTASGTYTLLTSTKVGTLSCPKTYTASIIVNPNPTITVSAKRTAICRGETNTLTANGATSYSWTTNPSTTSVAIVSPTTSTNFTVTGTNADGCKHTIVYNAKVSICNGLKELTHNTAFSVFPNPNAGEFVLKTESDMDVDLFNEIGQHLRSLTLNEANGHQLKITDLSAGIYFIKAEQNGHTYTQKIVVTK